MALFREIAPGGDADRLVDALLGARQSVELVAGSAVYVGAAGQGSLFTGGTALTGFGRGILLTTGDGTPRQTVGYSTSSYLDVNQGGGGDADLLGAVRAAFRASFTNDANTLTFQINNTDPSVRTVTFDVAFGSEEYPQFVEQFVDIGAIFVNGRNVALFEGNARRPLSVTEANRNAGAFQQNDGIEASLPIEYNAFSNRLTVTGRLVQGINTIKIGIADTGLDQRDFALDSGLFVGNMRFGDAGGGGINVAPSAANDRFVVAATGSSGTVGNVLANDTDPDGDALEVVEVNGVEEFVDDTIALEDGGLIRIDADGRVLFDPNGDFDDLDAGESRTVVVAYSVGDGELRDDGVLRIVVTGSSGGIFTEQDDVYRASDEAERLDALGGNDSVLGRDGDDTILGRLGDDTLRGERGADSLVGAEGDDVLDGGFGHDRLDGDAGADSLLGGENNDLLFGGGGADRLAGGSGADTVTGGGGVDQAFGGTGADVFVLSTDAGHIVVQDFALGEDAFGLVGLIYGGLRITADGIFASRENGTDDLLAVFADGTPAGLSRADFTTAPYADVDV